jgi:hypothetical protein
MRALFNTVLVLSLFIVGCGTGEVPQDAAIENVTFDSELQTNGNDPMTASSFSGSALYVTNHDQVKGYPAMHFAADNSVRAQYGTCGNATFYKLPENTSLMNPNTSNRVRIGEFMEPTDLKLGDYYQLVKNNCNSEYKVYFRVVGLKAGKYMRIRFEVKDHRYLDY